MPTKRKMFIIYDVDGSDIYFHGVVFAPMGISENEARTIINNTFDKIKNDYSEDWNYGDLLTALSHNGFTINRDVEGMLWEGPKG
jgi:hypothetical protein